MECTGASTIDAVYEDAGFSQAMIVARFHCSETLLFRPCSGRPRGRMDNALSIMRDFCRPQEDRDSGR